MNSVNVIGAGLAGCEAAYYLAKKGYNVVYGPISKIIGNIEREHFSGNDRTTLTNVLDCDLLIFDDLGTEFTTSFVSSTIFDIVNSRILKNKPTIINTNLEFDELKQKNVMASLLENKIFQRYIIMSNLPKMGTIREIYNGEGKLIWSIPTK